VTGIGQFHTDAGVLVRQGSRCERNSRSCTALEHQAD